MKSYDNTVNHVLKNETLILPQLPTKQKWGIITALVSGFIGLVYEGISSFLLNRRHKALHKAVKAMESKTTIQHNKLMHLEDSIVMYDIYNADTLGRNVQTQYTAFTVLHHLMKTICRTTWHSNASTHIS